MKEFELKQGRGTAKFSINEKDVIGVLDNIPSTSSRTEEEVIIEALQNPISSSKLSEIVHTGEKICIVIPDITRAWQKSSLYLPFIVAELTKAGIVDEDILFISATGSHRKQTENEYKQLLGDTLYGKYNIIDHDCRDKDNLVYLGKTSFGTPVSINKKAMECNHIIVAGGIVYHFLVGWSGGKKSILPGIASYETIMANHGLSLNESLGEGTRGEIRCGNIINNPVHLDMEEACAFVKPSFMFNVIIDSHGNISAAVAGDCIKAHAQGRKYVDESDCAYIKEKADLVIATAGGYPKDINFYQSSKLLMNSREAAKIGGTIIALTQCSEGLGGDDDVRAILSNYDSLLDREKSLRARYTISKHVGCLACETAHNFNLILVSNLDPKFFKNTGIKIVKTIDEALNLTYTEKGKNLKTFIMPHGANTLPKLLPID
ncbi:nickel-dependent lactate racemase [Clostridium estertheticum]|uniref:Nickel-dependent lactate racemase n=1 Tax=Clostridium estertheticum TaxID=238834 RepID=A0A7Y3WTK3_9CLOT|nr:nickel-dependent lactate racemase [Clostridium estertheticum]NNU77236.1 nickel-dependent lactate racemase [Clostridium estertheticum]WBL45672.1 nickel-dependent lactate racemase [Clostridium estertheticum]